MKSLSLQLLHRVTKLTHRQAYFDIFVVAVLAPLAALVAVVVLGTLFGSF